MSEKSNVKCTACQRRAEALKIASIRLMRKAQAVMKPIRKR